MARRRILFLTGTRAELGLMLETLKAIRAHRGLELLVAATGMHLDPRYGKPLASLEAAGIRPDAVVPWTPAASPLRLAEATADASGHLARLYRRLAVDGLLVVGDRVEAFAAASAAHVARIPIAHVHGGDRAEGQVDDALRHAITKLSHLHLAATPDSAGRILRLGEHPDNVHIVGAPGVELIRRQVAPKAAVAKSFPGARDAAIVLLHPTSPDTDLEHLNATRLLAALERAGVKKWILLAPNNDPGSAGILRAWKKHGTPISDLPRPLFIGLMASCRLLAGNSSAGIIEAASFGTPVLDVGPRQQGRLRGENVLHADFSPATSSRGSALDTALRQLLAGPVRYNPVNPYHRSGTARSIARLLATALPTPPAPPKLITF